MYHHSIKVAGATALSILPVPGLAGYFADHEGNIYSTRRGTLKKLSPTLDPSSGYLRVLAYEKGKPRRNRYVHHLVALAFHGERPPGLMVCHTPDPNKMNNRPENLRYQTHRQNIEDSIRDGTLSRPVRKLDYAKAEEIRALHETGMSLGEIARRFGVARQTAQKVVSFKTWRKP